jgi:predicted Na+-dependent transporter
MGKVADIICCLFLVPVFAGVVTRLLRKKWLGALLAILPIFVLIDLVTIITKGDVTVLA